MNQRACLPTGRSANSATPANFNIV
jgi:hypothetical protein